MSEDHPNPDKRWEGLVRANILSTTTNKLFGYIQLVDQKCMGLILLNSAIIPMAMNWMHQDKVFYPALISVLTGVLSIFIAIWCIFPKRGRTTKADGEPNLLHFTDIAAMSEEKYLELMRPLYNDRSLLGIAVIKDIHDVSSRVLKPKFKLLKASYIVFFIGNFAAVCVFLYRTFS